MRDIEKIKERVLKLLELAQNNKNEAETLAALTKARFLIGKYKIDNIDFEKKRTSKIEPIREIVNMNFKKRYMLRLGDLISDYFPVEFLYGTRGNYRSCSIYGTKEDIDFAKSFMTSVDTFINKEVARIRAKINYQNKCFGYKHYETKNIKLSYYYGFLDGLDEKLQEQNHMYEEVGFAVALQTPKEVTKYWESMTGDDLELTNAEIHEVENIDRDFYLTGYKEGKQFSTNIIVNENH